MEKKILPYLILISAISVSVSAAAYSISGLGKMFSGASTQVMIMVGSLEFAKLVLASFVYQYWENINNILKTYYITALAVLMLITSGGIYGYLSAAYSETSNKMINIERQVDVLNKTKEIYVERKEVLSTQLAGLGKNNMDLTHALSNNSIQYKDKNNQVITTSSSGNRKVYEKQLEMINARSVVIDKELSILNDSIMSISNKILSLETNSDIAAEIGPLKYIANLTNKTIDQVVNVFIIALIFVFDPLAVSLIIGANIIFTNKKETVVTPQVNELIKSEETEIISDLNTDERKKLNDLQYDLTEERAILHNEKKRLKKELDDIQKEKEDLTGLKKEIEDWEKTHWKMRRNTYPKSAIIPKSE